MPVKELESLAYSKDAKLPAKFKEELKRFVITEMSIDEVIKKVKEEIPEASV